MKIINADVFDEIIFKNIEDVDTGVVTGITSTLTLPTGNLNNILINFNFINKKLCEELKLIANFNINKKECIDVPLQSFNVNGRTFENACFIPAEVFSDPCQFYLGLYGFSLDGENIKQRISLFPLKNIVVEGSYDPDAKEGIIPTPTAFEVYFNNVAEANNKLDEIIDAKTMYYKKYETSYIAGVGETEIPTGIINFSTLFSLIVDKNGLVLVQGDEYTIDYENNQIVLTNAVEVADTVFHFIGFATIIGTEKDMSDFINGDVVVADSIEWDKILNKPQTYTPPKASETVLGGIKVGANLTIEDDGTLNATGGGGTADSVEWDNIENKPEEFTPTAHTHTSADITDLKIPTKTSDLTNDSSYATETYVTNAIANAQLGGEGGDIDLSGYATKDDLALKADKSEIPTKTSQITNDSGFITEVPSEYITETELNAKGYLTEHQDISNLALKSDLHAHSNKGILDTITQAKVQNWDNKSDFSGNYNDLTNKPTIPTKTSELNNDSGFLTEHQDISNLATKTELNNKQDKLVAGDNITITGNTISATGGSGGASNILTFENIQVATTSFVEDTTYSEFGYKADIPCTGVTADFFSSVTFDVTEAISGNYAPISLTGAGIVTIYAVEQPESTITIPSIICSKGA